MWNQLLNSNCSNWLQPLRPRILNGAYACTEECMNYIELYLHKKVRESGTMVCRISFPRLARAKLSLSSVNSILVKSLLDLLVELFIRCSCMWIWMCMVLLLIGEERFANQPSDFRPMSGRLALVLSPLQFTVSCCCFIVWWQWLDRGDGDTNKEDEKDAHCEDDCYSCKVGLRPLTPPALFLKIPAVLIRSMHNMVKVCCQHLLCC